MRMAVMLVSLLLGVAVAGLVGIVSLFFDCFATGEVEPTDAHDNVG